MTLFLWENVDDLTDRYHSDGGLVIVAKSLDRARELMPVVRGIEPDKSFKLVGRAIQEEVTVFPNAGCC